MGDAPFTAEWRSDMFGGIMTIKGKWDDGTDLLAVPNYLRLNRVIGSAAAREGEQVRDWTPTSIVWINKSAD